jgi:NADH:ubiquinone oxidoreductase subunit 6 (subunit J)
MTPELIVFLLLAIVAVGAALGMLFSRNAVHSALFLVLTMGVISVFFLILAAPFIAMVQVTVYAGAIMVLFLFVIMLLGAEGLRRQASALPWPRWATLSWSRAGARWPVDRRSPLRLISAAPRPLAWSCSRIICYPSS